MSLVLYTAPAVEPISAADVRLQLGINDNASDTVISRRITEMRQWAEEYCRRAFISQTWDYYIDEFPVVIELPLGRTSAVTHIQYLDTSGTLQTLSATDYQTDLYSQPARIMPAYGASWPSIRDGVFNPVQIRYTVGYGASATDVPGPIREALLLAVGHLMTFQSGIEGAVSITRMPYAVLDLLSTYRLYEFGP